MMVKTCEHCSSEFEAEKANARYCSGNCRQKAYLKRKKTKNSPVDGVDVLTSKGDVKTVDVDMKSHHSLRDFLTGDHQHEIEADFDTDFGNVLTGVEAFHPAHLPEGKLHATEDLSRRLLHDCEKEEAKDLLKQLKQRQKVGHIYGEWIDWQIDFGGFQTRNQSLSDGQKTSIRRLFQKLLLFDRQKLCADYILATAAELEEVHNALNGGVDISSLRSLLVHIYRQTLQLLDGKNRKRGAVFGLSNNLRYNIQQFLMTA